MINELEKRDSKIIICSFFLLIKTISFSLIDFISKHYKFELKNTFLLIKYYFYIFIYILGFFVIIIWNRQFHY